MRSSIYAKGKVSEDDKRDAGVCFRAHRTSGATLEKRLADSVRRSCAAGALPNAARA